MVSSAPRLSCSGISCGSGASTNSEHSTISDGPPATFERPHRHPRQESRMTHYTYLIIGGGMTADSAVRGIRQVDPNGSIGLIGAEPDPPYNRPPLTKALWKGKPIERIWRKLEGEAVELHLGRKVQLLDPKNKRVTDDHRTEYTFDKLLLATGGVPKRLAFGDDQIIYYRTVEDYRRLRA